MNCNFAKNNHAYCHGKREGGFEKFDEGENDRGFIPGWGEPIVKQERGVGLAAGERNWVRQSRRISVGALWVGVLE